MTEQRKGRSAGADIQTGVSHRLLGMMRGRESDQAVAMLSYRHIFHAGNHADVLKHVTLVLALEHLIAKDKPVWYIDTHAGAGSYRLTDPEAVKNAEFEAGMARLLNAPGRPTELKPWLRELHALNGPGPVIRYPGSPAWAARVLRPQDKLKLFELHPQDQKSLRQLFRGDSRVEVRAEDGFAGLKALLPPPSRRALVLIDPPYEVKTDYEQVIGVLRDSQKRFGSGVYMLWYPLLNRPEAQRMQKRLEALAAAPWLRVELAVAPAGQGFGMYGSGLFVLNPPWRLREQLAVLLPWLADRLGVEKGSWSLRDSEAG